MKGWDIFRHSVRQVFWNLGGALRVSGVLYLVQIGLTLTLLGTVSVGDGGIGSAQASHQMSGAIVAPVVVVTLLIGLWIAVGWHRYVLLIEEPGLVPRLHMDRVLGYFGKGILIGLVMIIPAIVAGFLIGLALAAIASAAFKGQVLTIDTIIPLSLQIELSVVALIIAVLLTSRLTRSLHALAGAAGQVADGRLDQRVGHISDDDVGDVAVAFNRMTASLQHSVSELTQQRSLAAVGEFAASLSHEVRNSLTAVRIDLQHANRLLVKTDATTDGATNAAAPLVARALGSVRQLDTTVTSALRVARGGHVERTAVLLHEIVQRAMRSADATFAERGGTLLPFESAAESTLFVDAGALEQMFLNVLLNAAQSLSAGGHASVRATVEADLVSISITDTGSGVSPADLSAIGTPFFSSKPNGTGLGLPLARRIAEAHGGTLRIENAVPIGTMVTITIPRPL